MALRDLQKEIDQAVSYHSFVNEVARLLDYQIEAMTQKQAQKRLRELRNKAQKIKGSWL